MSLFVSLVKVLVANRLHPSVDESNEKPAFEKSFLSSKLLSLFLSYLGRKCSQRIEYLSCPLDYLFFFSLPSWKTLLFLGSDRETDGRRMSVCVPCVVVQSVGLFFSLLLSTLYRLPTRHRRYRADVGRQHRAIDLIDRTLCKARSVDPSVTSN